VGGCFSAYDVLQRMSGIREFLEHVEAQSDYRTVIDRTSDSGISISCRIG
jgi:hypothetical protein